MDAAGDMIDKIKNELIVSAAMDTSEDANGGNAAGGNDQTAAAAAAAGQINVAATGPPTDDGTNPPAAGPPTDVGGNDGDGTGNTLNPDGSEA